ncbi:MAG: hypothetical protein Q4A03_08185 [Rothia sp. (in: high G+C Gram-positive bacteria)]|uniref:hypothetical protein n=1 Tax=Rothia sp. (in: high G+C Gram-positive bacteria) TaxID=1885016 RepID=UPI002706A8AB|nr:hypothetical protein [Rothia sp. (in: high G+C Gram-positive bacteria)]
MTTHKPQSTWGRSRFGGSQTTLLLVSILGGALLAQLLAWGIITLRSEQVTWWWVPVASLAFIPALAATFWAVLVDRNTIKGATHNPEASVENYWYGKAAETTFHLMIAAMGLGAGAFAIFDWQVSPSLLLTSVTVLAILVFLVSYQVYKRKGA